MKHDRQNTDVIHLAETVLPLKSLAIVVPRAACLCLRGAVGAGFCRCAAIVPVICDDTPVRHGGA